MRAQYHLGVSLVVSGSLYVYCKSWELAVISLVSGTLVDLDHLVDYHIEHGAAFHTGRFLDSFSRGTYKKIYILLHGWEWLLLWAVIAWMTEWNLWIAGFLIGHAHHIVLDQLSNGAHTWGYSLLWRRSVGFDPDRVFPRGCEENDER